MVSTNSSGEFMFDNIAVDSYTLYYTNTSSLSPDSSFANSNGTTSGSQIIHSITINAGEHLTGYTFGLINLTPSALDDNYTTNEETVLTITVAS
jgi:hypothetical protein